MKIEIINQRRNELLKRNEVLFRVNHEGGGTPSRLEIRQKLASMINANEESVYVGKFETMTGAMIAVGEARIYDTVEQARYVEPEHIIARNTSKGEKKE